MDTSDNVALPATELRQNLAKRALWTYRVFQVLAESEHNARTRSFFDELSHIAEEEFSYWAKMGVVRGDAVSVRWGTALYYRCVRLCFGAVIVARYISRTKRIRSDALMRLHHEGVFSEADIKIIRIFRERSQALIESQSG